jgi:hypothetical protein
MWMDHSNRFVQPHEVDKSREPSIK